MILTYHMALIVYLRVAQAVYSPFNCTGLRTRGLLGRTLISIFGEIHSNGEAVW